MKFEELLKRTTPTPRGMGVFDDDCLIWGEDGESSEAYIGPSQVPGRSNANALRLAHGWNELPRLLAAIKAKAALDEAMGNGQRVHFMDYNRAEAELKAAIAAAEEIPNNLESK